MGVNNERISRRRCCTFSNELRTALSGKEIRTMRNKPLSAAFLLFCLAAYGIPTLQGQAVSGAITGYAYDPSEAPIVGATVTAKNVGTGITTTRNTDSTGLYLVTNLNPGTYSVTVEAAGFRRFVQENVVLRVDSTMRVDAH